MGARRLTTGVGNQAPPDNQPEAPAQWLTPGLPGREDGWRGWCQPKILLKIVLHYCDGLAERPRSRFDPDKTYSARSETPVVTSKERRPKPTPGTHHSSGRLRNQEGDLLGGWKCCRGVMSSKSRTTTLW